MVWTTNEIEQVLPQSSEFMGKMFQAAQLTHERFMTIDHSWKIFFWYLPNWTSTDLWCVVLYVTYSTTHQRLVEVQFGRYQKNILHEWSMVKNLSCVSCAAWNIFPINSLLASASPSYLATCKVQLFWEGHKNLKKSPTCFDTTELGWTFYTGKAVFLGSRYDS